MQETPRASDAPASSCQKGKKGVGMPKIRRALISVTDKSGVGGLGKTLHEFGVQILSTGGTARALSAAGVAA